MSSLTRTLSTRVAKKLEKPKPLKNAVIPNRHSYSDLPNQYVVIQQVTEPEVKQGGEAIKYNADDTFTLLQLVITSLVNKDYSNIQMLTATLTSRLKAHGSQLEEMSAERLEKSFEVLRTNANDRNLDRQSRLNVLHLIEMRAFQWQPPLGFFSYYLAGTQGQQSEILESCGDGGIEYGQQLLSPGEVIRQSGKYGSPTRVPGKNYCKDEVVIRNADSGKVMGIKGRRVHMIEELSETVISFQRVNPGARERLVQITGPNEEKIVYAMQLIEDTIKRNASPVREIGLISGAKDVIGSNSSINSSTSDESNRFLGNNVRPGAGASLGRGLKEIKEYSYSVHVVNDVINLSSSNLELLNHAKLLLDSTYNPEEVKASSNTTSHGQPIVQSTPNGSYVGLNENMESLPIISSGSNSKTVTCDVANDETLSMIPETIRLLNRTPSTHMSDLSGVMKQYSRQFLLDCSSSKAAMKTPPGWPTVVETFPAIVKESPSIFDVVAYQKKWLEFDGNSALLSSNTDDYVDSD